MSTYSTNLALELIGTGERSGTWGTATNTNLGTLVEQAISGYVTQAITDGADTTITIPNGADGVARNMYIECTGALTASRNLIVPANKKLYFIFNNTTGGYSVSVKVSGQTGIVVPNGRKVALVCNGTDVYVATDYLKTANLGAAADYKNWDISPSSAGLLIFRAVNDAFTSSLTYLTITRVGISTAPADYSGGQFRVSASMAHTTGAGLELAYQSSIGYVSAYDRDAAVYRPMIIRSSGTTFQVNAVTGLILQDAGGGLIDYNFSNPSTSSSSTGGGATALPTNPVGYLQILINSVARKVPYYAA